MRTLTQLLKKHTNTCGICDGIETEVKLAAYTTYVRLHTGIPQCRLEPIHK